MQISEVMTPDPVCATPDTPLKKISTLMTEHACGAIPIVENGRVTGIITDRDLVCRVLSCGVDPFELTAADVMTRDVVTIHAESHAEAAEALMKKQRVRRLPVVAHDGRLIGIISATDLAIMKEELDAGTLYPKLAHHVPRKTSAKFRVWL